MIKERRRANRIVISTPVGYQQKGSKRFGKLMSRDISDSGIGFTSDEFFPMSSQYIFEFRKPDCLEFTKVLCQVVWISSQPYSEKFSVGAKFLEYLDK